MSWEEIMNLLNQAGGKTAAGLVGQNPNTGEIPPNELINYILGKDTSAEIANYPTAHENIDWEMFLDGIKKFGPPIADVFNPVSGFKRIKSGGEEIGEQIASFLARQDPVTNEIPEGIFGSGDNSISFDGLKDMIKRGLLEGNRVLRGDYIDKWGGMYDSEPIKVENPDVTDIVSILKDFGPPYGDEFAEATGNPNLIQDLMNQILGGQTQ